VSIMPGQPSQSVMSPTVRTLLFWVLMVLLAVILWRMVSVQKSSDSGVQQMSYSDFLAQADKNNIATATFALSQSTAEVRGNLRQPASEYRSTVPRESVSDLTDRLRKQGVNVEISQMADSGIKNTLITFAPVLVIALFLLFVNLARIRRRSAPADPAKRPLG